MKTRLFLAALLAGFLMQPVHAADQPADTYELLNLFGDIFERVRNDYVEEPTDQQLVESAITGMLTALDPHSSYLNAKNFREMQVQTRGQFGGLGIQVSMDRGLVKVISPIDDTPAFRAGIEPSDIITHLDGEGVLGMTLGQAVEKMRGLVNTDIKLTIRRGAGKPFDVTITRAVIRINSVRSHIEDKIGYIRVTSFNEQAEKGIKKAMAKFEDEIGNAMKGVVLDLRRNPGGLLDQAIAVSDAFLDKGEIVSTRSRKEEDSQRFNARPGDLAKGLPMVVLINEGSASASEIVAGALQDHSRAIIMGTKSFGKGSVQTVIPLGAHGAIRLTTARYYTPSGRSIQAVGIEPDIEVQQAKVETIQHSPRTREADLRGALENGNAQDDKGETTENADEKKKDVPFDYQLERAFDLLRGLAFYSESMAAGQ